MNTPELRAATGATQQNVFYWRSQGFISPENDGHGQGTPLDWSEATAAHCRKMVAYVALGCSPSLAHELAAYGLVEFATPGGVATLRGAVK